MALFSFGKKDKKPPEAPAPVVKAPPTPPKIQTPPASASAPTVKPPQPSGLVPVTGLPSGTATTQPMIMPRGTPPPPPGLKPSRPGVAQSARSTQRIVLPSGPGNRPITSTKPLSVPAPTGRINLPMGMILRCLPPEVLAADLSEFEASGAAATEIGLPMNMILSQLPSGKVEIALQDLIPHFPAGYLQPTDSISSYLPNLINLPLMDVVMRIPPDLLALRPDQKDVDAAVINMADPFTEEILREQAETARQQTQTNIIEESQAPKEEFIPRDQGTKTVAPPPRPPSVPLPTPRSTTVATPPMPPAPEAPRTTTPTPALAPSTSARTISPSGRLPTPSRATAPIPAHTQGLPQVQTPSYPSIRSTAPIPPVPRSTAPLPLTPQPPVAISPQPPVVPTPVMTKAPAPTPASLETPAATTPASTTASNVDHLQRLAALAMEQLGESDTESTPAESSAEAPAEPPKETVPEAETASFVIPPPPPVETQPPVVRYGSTSITQSLSTPVEVPQPIPPIPTPVVPPTPPVVQKSTPEPPPSTSPIEQPKPQPEAQPASASVAFNLNTCTSKDLVQNIPGCFSDLAESIIQYRSKIGSFKRLEDLLDVPGMTKAAYTNLTGETPPDNRMPPSLNELLGFPAEQHLSLKDVADRIACWPDVTGCILSQSSGLPLVGTVPEGLNKEAIVAFAPRMFESLNKSFSEIAGKETNDLIIPAAGNSFHIFRNRDLYLIILSRLPQMPERHLKVARFVLAALSIRRD